MQNLTFTIFGSTGDLSYRKLMPAFYNLFERGLVEENVIFLAVGRRNWDKAKYLETIKPWVEKFARYEFNEEKFLEFSKHVDYLEMQFTEAEDYKKLLKYYNSLVWSDSEEAMHIFYLAVAPEFFSTIVDNLATNGCIKGECRTIIEKPFGPDLETAKSITQNLENAFGKDNVFHIDHYLGKEMVQNLYMLHALNPLIQASLNKNYVESVEINALEKLDIGQRGAFYDSTGALEDMIQSHLLQTLSIFAMESDAVPGSDEFQVAQTALLKSIRTPVDDISTQVALGQYEGYTESEKVSPDSKTETYASVKLFIDNERWQNVPFYLSSGKALDRKLTNIVINYKENHCHKTSNYQHAFGAISNQLYIEIYPEAKISFKLFLEEPGLDEEIELITPEFSRESSCRTYDIPEAYERLVHACYEGKIEYFPTWEQIESTWKWMRLLKSKIATTNLIPEKYEKGSEGPKSRLSIRD